MREKGTKAAVQVGDQPRRTPRQHACPAHSTAEVCLCSNLSGCRGGRFTPAVAAIAARAAVCNNWLSLSLSLAVGVSEDGCPPAGQGTSRCSMFPGTQDRRESSKEIDWQAGSDPGACPSSGQSLRCAQVETAERGRVGARAVGGLAWCDAGTWIPHFESSPRRWHATRNHKGRGRRVAAARDPRDHRGGPKQTQFHSVRLHCWWALGPCSRAWGAAVI